jgi:N-acetylglutamate synthase-like GNAT family acetyltransferase
MVWIRRASGADAERLTQLLDELGYPSATDLVAHALEEAMVKGAVIVAENDNHEVVAFASYQFVYFFEDAAPRCRVTAIVVDEMARKSHAGRELLHEIERLAQAAGCTAVEATSARRRDREPAHLFYSALGYVDGSVDSTFFVKRLPAPRSEPADADRDA